MSNIMVLQSVYENSYNKARNGDVFQGGDWRIWLFNLMIELVQTIVFMGVSHGISSKLAVKGGKLTTIKKIKAAGGLEKA